jgi:4-hydroxybenzoyl-CoA thioesterase
MSFVSRQRIRFGQCDPAGIAYFPRLIELIDVAVEDWTLQGTGISRRTLHFDLALGLPTVAIETRFERPCRLDEAIDIAIDVSAVGNSSVALSVVATCDGAPRYAATLTQVLINLGTGKAVRWPAVWRVQLERQVLAEAVA